MSEALFHRVQKLRFSQRRKVRRLGMTSGPNKGAAAIGQLTLWESGRCDTEAHATRDRTPILLRSRVLDEPARVPAIADDLVDHVADYSNS